jgi:hypothetical protein
MMELPPIHSRDSKGTALFKKSCQECGKVSIVDRRRIGKPCHKCAMKKRITHGLTVGGRLHPLYSVLKNIEARCRYPSATHFEYYGGRGISICKEWTSDPASFVAWATANGWRKGLEIDRIDSNGDYRPDNCRVISHRENCQKTRRNRSTPEQITAVRQALKDGASIKAAAQQAGVSYMIAWHVKNTPDVWSNIGST